MKTIPVPMGEDLLTKVNEKMRLGFKNRSVFIREACKYFIKSLEEREKEKAYIRGYRKFPEETQMAKVSSKLSSQIMSREKW